MMLNSDRRLALFTLLAGSAPNKVFALIVLGALSGIANALIIPLVLMPLQGAGSEVTELNTSGVEILGFQITTPRAALAFLITCVFILCTSAGSQVMLRQVQIRLERELREFLYRRISQLPIADLERIGSARLETYLTLDIRRLVRGAVTIPNVIVSLMRALALLLFLLYVNVHIFNFLIAVLVAGIILYRIPLFLGVRVLNKAREAMERLQTGIKGLIFGAKELKLNRARRDAFYDEELLSVERSLQQYEIRGSTLVMSAAAFSDLLNFLAIGILTYALAGFHNLTPGQMLSAIMVMIFITGPIREVVSAALPITHGMVSLRAFDRLLREMPTEECDVPPAPAPWFGTVRLEGVVHRYAGRADFQLGPIDLTLHRGEVIFLVGGNGSGKTTLAKVISLHYRPQAGAVLFDGVRIGDANRETYRQTISAIYSDFYLFTKLFGVSADDLQRCAEYLRRLRLEQAVTVTPDGVLSGVRLSDGQRKRLALVVSYLENRAICVLDEWAADQDPQFKQVFYSEIVPALREVGKLVVILSHDDRFFHIADMVVKLENGQVAEITRRDTTLNAVRDAERSAVHAH